MELKIVVNSGEEAGASRRLVPGQTLRVGRTQAADLRLPDDAMLSSVHFSLEVHADNCRITDMESKFGTKVNGQKIQAAELVHGDVIEAGRTRFTIMIAGETRVNHQPLLIPPPAPPVETSTAPVEESPTLVKVGSVQRQVLNYFQALASTTTVFGIMDAAREPAILEKLNQHGEQCQSLYEGEKGEALAPFGPWLVKLPGSSKLLAEFINEGWGQSWGVYLTSTLPFAEVRKHFRQFLRVLLPDGRHVYFRYYDPRVLRTYLASSSAQVLKEFFGSLQRIVMEAAEGDGILEYSPHEKGARRINLKPG